MRAEAHDLNKRGHARRALFDRLEQQHLHFPEARIFHTCMNRDYRVPCYFMHSASARRPVWALAYNIISGLPIREWEKLQTSGLILIKSFNGHYNYAHSQARVEYELTEQGKKYIVDTVLLLNHALALRTGRSPQWELAIAEDLILGQTGIDRYIRVGA